MVESSLRWIERCIFRVKRLTLRAWEDMVFCYLLEVWMVEIWFSMLLFVQYLC